MADYHSMSDEQLIEKLRDGDASVMDFLLGKYKNLVRKEANAMYLLGGENEDLIQEGMIGLFKAIRDFDPGEETSFASFARLCVNRQMATAIQASNRKKNGPLNSYVPLDDHSTDESVYLNQTKTDAESDPESLLISQEDAQLLEDELKAKLSRLENRVLYLHLAGTDYKTIAQILDKSPKTIDNALQRIKAKLRKILESEKK